MDNLESDTRVIYRIKDKPQQYYTTLNDIDEYKMQYFIRDEKSMATQIHDMKNIINNGAYPPPLPVLVLGLTFDTPDGTAEVIDVLSANMIHITKPSLDRSKPET
jgi:hypothetical protein